MKPIEAQPFLPFSLLPQIPGTYFPYPPQNAYVLAHNNVDGLVSYTPASL